MPNQSQEAFNRGLQKAGLASPKQIESYKKKYGERSEAEYARIKALKEQEKSRAFSKYQQEQNLEQKKFSYQQRQAAYRSSKTGKAGSVVGKVFGFLRSPTRTMYAQPSFMSQTGAKTKYAKAGRPVGTKDPRYAAYGGVYGYRKAQSQQRALERIRAQSGAGLNPEEQALLQKIRAQQMAQRENPEGRIIPDTAGSVPMQGFMAEIDRAANLVD